MNERIKILTKQAFDSVWDLNNDPIGPGTHFIPDGFEAKFAELIVRECDRYARSTWEHGPLLGKDLLVHFGFEQ